MMASVEALLNFREPLREMCKDFSLLTRARFLYELVRKKRKADYDPAAATLIC